MPGHGAIFPLGRAGWGSRLSPALKGFDDDHVPAAARTRRADIGRVFRSVGGRRRHTKQMAGASKTGLAGRAGEQAVMTDAVKALGQDMQQEAADTLRDVGHAAIHQR